MPDPTLLLLLDEVRGKTLRLLETITAEDAGWAPPGLQNTILWHAGHSYFLLEWLAMKAIGQRIQMPDGWYEMFSWDSKPRQIAADRWPQLAQVIAALREQHKRMRHNIGGLTAPQLDEPSARNPAKPVRFEILHALHDEACHCGEIHLLRKLRAVDRERAHHRL
jgi:DinB superfamily